MILAGDIGGTKTVLACYEKGRHDPLIREVFHSRDYASLTLIVRTFLARHPVVISAAAFGIAGPIQNNRVHLTNLSWVIDAVDLSAELAHAPVRLLNDLESNAFGIDALEPNEFVTLQTGVERVGNQALISAGTGLGEAGLAWDGLIHRPFATEGGHCDFGPADELDCELLIFLKAKFGRVSWERVLSGLGFANIYEFLETKIPSPIREKVRTAIQTQGDAGAVISHFGISGECPTCAKAVELLIKYYGAEAGNLALKIMSIGGLYIGGGIAPKLLPQLQAGGFIASFIAKGRLAPVLESMPVRVILNQDTALLGAARVALNMAAPAG